MKYEIAGFILDFQCKEDWIHDRFKYFLSDKQWEQADIIVKVLEKEPPIIDKKEKIAYSGTGTPLYHMGERWCFTWEEDNTIPYLASSTSDWKETDLYVKEESILYMKQTFPSDWLLRIKNQLLQAVMQAFRYGVLSLGGVYLHGILAEYKGKGIGFSAASGTGKTTHMNLWKEAGYSITILNGDNFVLRKEDNTVYAYGIPWCGSSEQFINKKVEYFGTVFIEQGLENFVDCLKEDEAYMEYVQRSFLPRFDKDTMEKGLNRIEEMLLYTNYYILKCRPDIEAVSIMKDKLDLEFTNN